MALAPCVAIVSVYGAFSVAATHDYLAWNAARRGATDMVMESGVHPRQIDGNYDFNGWLFYDRFYKAKREKSNWWVIDDEYVIASGPIDGYDQKCEVPVDRWLAVTPSAVITLHRSESRGCDSKGLSGLRLSQTSMHGPNPLCVVRAGSAVCGPRLSQAAAENC